MAGEAAAAAALRRGRSGERRHHPHDPATAGEAKVARFEAAWAAEKRLAGVRARARRAHELADEDGEEELRREAALLVI